HGAPAETLVDETADPAADEETGDQDDEGTEHLDAVAGGETDDETLDVHGGSSGKRLEGVSRITRHASVVAPAGRPHGRGGRRARAGGLRGAGPAAGRAPGGRGPACRADRPRGGPA